MGGKFGDRAKFRSGENRLSRIALKDFMKALEMKPFLVSIPRHRLEVLVGRHINTLATAEAVNKLVNKLVLDEILRRSSVGLGI